MDPFFLIFILVMAVGLGVFFQTLMREIRTGSPGPVEAAALPGRRAFGLGFPGKEASPAMPGGLSLPPDSGQSAPDIKEALVQKLDQKCLKLEELLAEKNRTLARLEEDLKNEQKNRKEFETLKGILEGQINEMKVQNRTLREELARALQENLALQPPSAPLLPADVPSGDGDPGSQEPLRLRDVMEERGIQREPPISSEGV